MRGPALRTKGRAVVREGFSFPGKCRVVILEWWTLPPTSRRSESLGIAGVENEAVKQGLSSQSAEVVTIDGKRASNRQTETGVSEPQERSTAIVKR